MIINHAMAIRKDGKIEVTVLGNLPDTCFRAKITKYYPGNIKYIIDPGEAQVWISEYTELDHQFCLQILVPWVGFITLEDEVHNTVGLYVNEKKDRDIKVVSVEEYSVYQLTGGIYPPNSVKNLCYIFPDFGKERHPFTRVFGPDNYKACLEWVMQDENLSLYDGGGSGNPKGLKVKQV